VVPVPARPAAVAAAAPRGAAVSLTDFTRSGLSPITSAAIAALVATVLVWIGGKLRRRP